MTAILSTIGVAAGLLVLGGLGPTERAPGGGAPLPEPPAIAIATTSPISSTTSSTTVPVSTTTTGSTSPTTTPTTLPAGPTSTTHDDPAPSTSTTTTPRAAPASAVVASQSMVGVGGVVTFTGTCPDASLGSLVVVIGGPSAETVDTGIATTRWEYRWAAPVDDRRIGSFTFEFWCGDPTGATDGGSPTRFRVDMVASAPPPPLPPPAADGSGSGSGAPAVTLPRTT